MSDAVSVLGIIPARAGSRGIPHKNTILVAGKPLIQWTIEAALASTSIDRVVVTTDDPDVARIAAGLGVDIVDRPASLAGDAVTAAEVIAHVLSTGVTEEIVVYLQPTSPLRDPADIDACVALLDAAPADGVVSVTAVTEHPEWMYRIDPVSLELAPVIAMHDAFRRQDLPRSVRLNGAVYCASANRLRPDGNFFRLSLAGYEMPGDRSIDIDVPADLAEAERLLLSRAF